MELRQTFESSVNSEGIETSNLEIESCCKFESSVNSEGIETLYNSEMPAGRLRAV